MPRLAEAGVPVGVMVAPVIPASTTTNSEAVLEAARERRRGGAGYVLLRLPHEVKDLFREWLARHDPLKAEHVMSRCRTRGRARQRSQLRHAHARHRRGCRSH